MACRVAIAAVAALSLWSVAGTKGQSKIPPPEVIPHAQTKPPGPPLSPQEALRKMEVPPGFRVELVACEPQIVNPVAMAFDERGRIWLTESVEYPRKAAGPGKDRVKVLESTKGDGNFDKITTVLEGLNIPSGIAVGHGGVWIANAPDIRFYPFLDRETLKLGPPQVVCTGFGRYDTHELPNSLTWGPDGWLYGLNGVFNPSVVKSNNGKTYSFTCALFRIHPRTKEFQVWCEGTSNPWGLAFNDHGDAFVSACVIDHLWHLVETGYYHRQSGPYPPFTWKIESIVQHRHQKAAYCGLTWFDSAAYPPEYRGKLYMGNIHGGAINCDMLVRDGATYRGLPALSGKPQAGLAAGVGDGSNFLLANDAWFMPVVQKTGPDGCLYILDWYDRYHCYQDANRDPAGIDRLRGRLYRVVYKDYRPPGLIDLAKESNERLLERLGDANILYRELAQRNLVERLRAARDDELLRHLWRMVREPERSRTARLHALWVLASLDFAQPLEVSANWNQELLTAPDPTIRAWAIRAGVGNPLAPLRGLRKYAADPAPEVQLQVAIAARKLPGVEPIPVLLDVLAHCGSDRLIPRIVWQNLHPLLESQPDALLRALAEVDWQKAHNIADLMPRIVDRLVGAKNLAPTVLADLIISLGQPQGNREACAKCLAVLTAQVQSGELAGPRRAAIGKSLLPSLHKLANNPNLALALEATFLAASLDDGPSRAAARRLAAQPDQPESYRLKALAALVAAGDGELLPLVRDLLTDTKGNSLGFRSQVLPVLGRLDHPELAAIVLEAYPRLEPEVQPKAIDLLTQRPSWSKRLLGEIEMKKLPPSTLNVNQVRKLLASRDKALVDQVAKVWGTVRTERNPQREQVVGQMRELLKKTPGDPFAGRVHFNKICAQCHKLYGEGQEVGPDI
ncbi:MAG: hypothetical protein NZ700_05930, partial [Gemmataceae bacterium]|nr:hypothetical protein [Gemmataceae bacterium]